MHDLRALRDTPDSYDQGWASRGLEPQAARLIALDDARRKIVSDLQAVQEKRNVLSREIGQAKRDKDEARAETLMAEVAALKDRAQAGEDEERAATEALEAALAELPNIPLGDVPVGADEADNALHRTHGGVPDFDFAPKEHFEIGETLGLMDFETAAKISGARFVILRGALARLERALAQFMLDLHTSENGYTEINPPMLVRDRSMYGTAQLPKFADDQFRTENGYWLIPTAEVPLTNLARENIWAEGDLPIRVTAHTPCFRQEAGAAGRDTRGMIRQHQFSKVELVSITTPDQSLAELERMRDCAEMVLQLLGLPYRVMVLSTGDMGFGARKTYDIEVWLPGQGAYREISSCSVCGDFQARRMNARYRPDGEKQPRFVHTLNGSGLAVGRTLIAVLENGQQADGSVVIPEALRTYMGGLDVIAPKAG